MAGMLPLPRFTDRPPLMPLPVVQDPVHNDVRHISSDDVPEHTLQIVNSSNLLAITLPNAREPGEAAKAATSTQSARPRLDGLSQLT